MAAVWMQIIAFAEDMFFEDDDEEIDFRILLLNETKKRKLIETVRIKFYTESVIPYYSDNSFRENFRMQRSTFELLLNEMAPLMETNYGGRPCLRADKVLLCAIWTLATPDSFRSIGDRFDVPKSTVYYSLVKVSTILCNILAKKYIKLPTRWEESAREFQRFANFPGVVGAIDGTHIPIKAPVVAPEQYYNRKNRYSLILQAIADSKMLFLDCFCSYPGSVHDSRVLRNSEVYPWILQAIPDSYHVVGDAAYPLLNGLLTPFKNNGHLTVDEINYNTKHSKTRTVVERTFGLLKQRFRRLKFFDANNTQNVPLYVLAACVLHNFCIFASDPLLEKPDPIVVAPVRHHNDPRNRQSNLGRIKRRYLCQLLAN